MLVARHGVQRARLGAGGGRGDGRAPHLREKLPGHIQEARRCRLAGRDRYSRHLACGAGGLFAIDEHVVRTAGDEGIDHRREHPVGGGLAPTGYLQVRPREASGNTDDRAHHQHQGYTAGGDGCTRREEHRPGNGQAAHGGERRIGGHFQHAAENIGHHRGVQQCVAFAGRPKILTHCSDSTQGVARKWSVFFSVAQCAASAGPRGWVLT